MFISSEQEEIQYVLSNASNMALQMAMSFNPPVCGSVYHFCLLKGLQEFKVLRGYIVLTCDPLSFLEPTFCFYLVKYLGNN